MAVYTIDNAIFLNLEEERAKLDPEHLAKYEVHDSRWLPQCGCEVNGFEFWGELEDFIYSDDELLERIQTGYATIVEL